MQAVAWNMSMKARRAVTNLTATSIWKSTCWNAQQGESSDVRAVTNITATAIWKSTCWNAQQRDARVETVPAIFNVTNLPSRLSFSRFETSRAERLEEHGFESTTISDILKQKGDKADGHWLFCNTEDSVYDAVKSMTQHNVGALLVVKPGGRDIAGIVTERDYLRKIIVQGRSSKTTKVGDIMTEENKLITVTPETKVLQAMELMTEKRIRHIPVIKGGEMRGMVSIGDVVRAVVDEHREELDRLNLYIQGGY